MSPDIRTEHERQDSASKRGAAIAPALLVLLVLSAMPTVALACAASGDRSGEVSTLLDQSRRARKVEDAPLRALSHAFHGPNRGERVKPVVALQFQAETTRPAGRRDHHPSGSAVETESCGRASMARSGLLGLPPPVA